MPRWRMSVLPSAIQFSHRSRLVRVGNHVGELFRPFACQGFHLCPSCSQKRTLLFAEFLSHRLLLRLPHRVLTFTVPKMLRPSFRYHPELFAEVSCLIYRLVRQFHPGAARRPIRSGGLIAYQT
jgi:hypothetical protein